MHQPTMLKIKPVVPAIETLQKRLPFSKVLGSTR